jgi:catechol 2,3-dioxygenase-like lactoylglutathione lyase family enzyme
MELAEFFYSEILGLPGQRGLGEVISWFDNPVHLAIAPLPYGEDPAMVGGFTGVHFHVVPAGDLDKYAETMLETGLKLSDPRDVGDVRILTIPDSSDNVLMLVGSDELPDEPVIGKGVGSISVFVEDIARSRSFFVDVLKLHVRAEPHEGLVVLGETGTALMLYQVPPDNPHTPIGRMTGVALADADLAEVLARIEASDGTVVEVTPDPELSPGAEPRAATVGDPDGNLFTLFAEDHLPDETAVE